MSTLEARRASALVVIDLQNDVVARAHAREAVLTNVIRLIERARRESVPVIWIQHHDDEVLRGIPGWELVPSNDQNLWMSLGEAAQVGAPSRG